MTSEAMTVDRAAALLDRAQAALHEYSPDYSWEAAEFLDVHAPWLLARLREVEAQRSAWSDASRKAWDEQVEAAWRKYEADYSIALREQEERAEKAEARIAAALPLLHGIDYDDESRVGRAVAALEGAEG